MTNIERLIAAAENGSEDASLLLAKHYFDQGEYSAINRYFKPLLKKNLPEALLMQVDFLMQKNPDKGIGLLYKLADENLPLANYKMAMLLYFHPELKMDFRFYLKKACQLKELPAIIATVSLLYQANEIKLANQFLIAHRLIPEIAMLVSALSIDVNELTEFPEFPEFPLLGYPDFTTLNAELISAEINLHTVEDFISDFDSAWLIIRAKTALTRSQVVDGETGEKQQSEIRTGQAAQLVPNVQDWILFSVEKKISEYINIPYTHGEISNVLNYKVGEEYKPHYDFFHPNDPGTAIAKKDGGQRCSTALIYLNSVSKGGETAFPRLNKIISPKRNQLVFYQNINANKEPLPLSLHQGCAVESGDKWLLSKWFREQPTSYKKNLVDNNL